MACQNSQESQGQGIHTYIHSFIHLINRLIINTLATTVNKTKMAISELVLVGEQ